MDTPFIPTSESSGLDYDFDESVGFWVATTHQVYMRSLQERLAPYGITYRQAQVLGWLVADGAMTQRELADRMLIEPPNLVGVLSRMEESGLIERMPCDRDRRKNRVRPQPKAAKLWGKIASCGRQVREQAVRGLTTAQRDDLKSLLAMVRDNLSEYPESSQP